ncbi:hypothetical protein T310_8507 [Rasamsonia emersonii CBS 393.64]|uniref:MFS multidrug transporter n=1 Tax=Rasamsonia emersonii (strain ATCC 16479 / CBS 393.64 / IMI 116815) TaxID=1408163 RepID=A0A0F4YI62_RASE3|nr:hypothetical protein T310_8507 [Rasamsonia emersonii CBS 393.64]KKA17556.1 hypothetical protein T310_8507 [Rasamsonia emersonii CBS 393.64]
MTTTTAAAAAAAETLSSCDDPSSLKKNKNKNKNDKDDEEKAAAAAADTTTGPNSTDQEEKEKGFITGIRLYLITVAVTLVGFLILLDMSIIATAVPRIASDFHALQDVGWYGSSYQLAKSSASTGKSADAQPVPLSSRWPGSCIRISAPSIFWGDDRRYRLLTWIATGFYINLPIGGLVAILLLFIDIPDSIKPRELSVLKTILTKLDLVGFALFAPAAIQFFLALVWGGNQFAWDSATVIGLFCGAGGTFIVFLVWEYFKGDEAMIPLSMVRVRAVWSACLVQLFFFGMLQLVEYFLPIYFQAVKGVSPMLSGVYLLPNVISQLIAGVAAGAAVSKLGYYLPWSVGSAMLLAVSNGLLSTLSPSTSTGKWIGYQILLGAARGMGMQMPLTAVQNSLPPALTSISMSLVTFCQTFGSAVFLTAGDPVFTNSLRTAILRDAPGVNPAVIVAAGATGIREVVTNPVQLAGVSAAYSTSIDRVFYLAVGLACACFCCTWGLGWKDIRKKEKEQEAPKEV